MMRLWKRMFFFEKLIVCYILLTAILFAIRIDFINQPAILCTTRLVTIVAIGLRLYFEKMSPIWRVIYTLFFVAMFLIFFMETQYFMHLFFPGWFDDGVIQVERYLFGRPLNVILESYYSPWLNEVIYGSYFLYYVLML